MTQDQTECAKWIVLGALAFTVLYGLYLSGESSGFKKAESKLIPQVRALTIKANELKQELVELEVKGVKECSLRAVDAVLDCEQACAQEVSSALEGCTLLLCGEVRGAPQ